MNDFINQLYRAYCENNKDMFASDEDGELKLNLEQIDKVLSTDLADKLYEIQLADSQRAFRYGFSVAMKLAMQGVSIWVKTLQTLNCLLLQ